MLKIYLAHPITGLSFEQVEDYYSQAVRELGGVYDILYPIVAKGYLRNEATLKASGYEFPPSTDNAIVGRDHWMVHTCDVFFADLTGAQRVSIGAVMELAWAKAYNKHIVLAMEPDNVHAHAFVKSSAHIVYESYSAAVQYLQLLGARLVSFPR
jgi:hypothetical protein